MRILISPQEFKGTLTALQAANAIARAIGRILPSAHLEIAPIADGGPGFLDAIVSITGGKYLKSQVEDPLGRPVAARWGTIGGGTAILEMAEASGLLRLDPAERDPRRTSTFGTGQLIRAALDADCPRIFLGIGGSATNDGGVGAAEALGVRFLDREGMLLPRGGAALSRLDRIDLAGRDPRLDIVQLWIAADVTNPLLGPTGASAIYGPQKGADEQAVRELDLALARLAEVTHTLLGHDLSAVSGAGAAGGLAFGLLAFCGGRLKRGFEVVAESLGLEERAGRADVVITGEGRLDEQSAFGKGPGSLAALAKRKGKRTVIFAGRVDPSYFRSKSPFDQVVEVGGSRPGLDPTPSNAGVLLEAAAEDWARREAR
jgi:glycerate 2-kinase